MDTYQIYAMTGGQDYFCEEDLAEALQAGA